MSLIRVLTIVGMSIMLLACAGAQQQQKNDLKIAESNWKLGVGYYQQGKIEAALEKLQKALNAQPDYSPAHSSIALVYQRLGDNKKAREHYETALQLEPANGNIHNNFATLLCQTGEPLEAEKHFLQAINSRGYHTQARALENLGSCLMQIPDFDKAEKYLREALSLNPKLPGALLQMVRISLEKKNFMSGRAYLQRFHEVASKNPQSLLLGIKVEQKLGDKKAASDYESQLRRNFPDSEETNKLLEDEFGKRENR
jgi:type IV pilus assembly protein PilF